mmetsp:Transcript_6391/g.10094  ORF Transcript_6391/g.10094 Transcript_6391/m.10094 type:complete len:127 (+) Transcript_6391:74-454(+)|eukprot:CAMPEP_0184302426 /NCGR_PEP_ID=MMETSP1049-20130417/12408_1 /TAXON_ID=77928 /ORGANISM="Proteomonas sulcata, Strain CCMP704" /LENGTH=126 /DNA_ID=CAMNT_0026613719 /DNA_START=33 /DNA_END=413 /DNA_ORIENTATION=+
MSVKSQVHKGHAEVHNFASWTEEVGKQKVEFPRYGPMTVVKNGENEHFIVVQGPGEATCKLPFGVVSDFGKKRLIKSRESDAERWKEINAKKQAALEAAHRAAEGLEPQKDSEGQDSQDKTSDSLK